MVCKMPETLPIYWLNLRLKLGNQEQSVAKCSSLSTFGVGWRETDGDDRMMIQFPWLLES